MQAGPPPSSRARHGEADLAETQPCRTTRCKRQRLWASTESGRASVLDRDYDDSILILEVDVDHEHPAPRAEDEAEARPATAEFRTDKRESLQRSEQRLEPGLCVGQEAMRSDQPIEVLDRGGAQLDARHGSNIVEARGLPGPCLLESCVSALECPGDPIEELDNVVGIDIGVVDRPREQGSCQRPFLHMDAFGETRELRRVLLVQGHVQSTARAHDRQISTDRHESCTRSGGPDSSPSSRGREEYGWWGDREGTL
jgi:hypothetical protein